MWIADDLRVWCFQMLSMVTSIFELRQGLQMPESVVELYDAATSALLTRAGAGGTSAALASLLQAVFCEAHMAGRRVITMKHLEVAARQLSGRSESALQLLQELVAQDRMPLLSLLQTNPLRMQAAHLSFQEYFAARAVSDGDGARLATPPWQLPAWWSNAVRLGVEMGDAFGIGLLRASGASHIKANQTRLEVTIAGDPRAAGAALGALLHAAPSVEELALGGRTADEAMQSLGQTLLRFGRGLSALRCDTFELGAKMTNLDLSKKGLSGGAALLLAAGLRGSTAMTRVKYARFP